MHSDDLLIYARKIANVAVIKRTTSYSMAALFYFIVQNLMVAINQKKCNSKIFIETSVYFILFSRPMTPSPLYDVCMNEDNLLGDKNNVHFLIECCHVPINSQFTLCCDKGRSHQILAALDSRIIHCSMLIQLRLLNVNQISGSEQYKLFHLNK